MGLARVSSSFVYLDAAERWVFGSVCWQLAAVQRVFSVLFVVCAVRKKVTLRIDGR